MSPDGALPAVLQRHGRPAPTGCPRASFVGMAGSLFLLGYDGLALVLGWTGGFVLVSIPDRPVPAPSSAPTPCRTSCPSARRNFAASSAWSCWWCCSFTYVTAQIYGTGIIASALPRHAVRDRGGLRAGRILLCANGWAACAR